MDGHGSTGNPELWASVGSGEGACGPVRDAGVEHSRNHFYAPCSRRALKACLISKSPFWLRAEERTAEQTVGWEDPSTLAGLPFPAAVRGIRHVAGRHFPLFLYPDFFP